MAFKTFAPGVLTSSDVNTFLMRQAVITCTSSTRPASPSEGMTIYETDTDVYRTYDGTNWVFTGNLISGAWTVFTPSWVNLTLGDAPTNTGSYLVIGKTVFLKAYVKFGSTTTVAAAPNGVDLNVPAGLTPSGGVENRSQAGIAQYRDFSADGVYSGVGRVVGTIIRLSVDNNTLPPPAIVAGTPWAWAVDDEIRLNLVYEV